MKHLVWFYALLLVVLFCSAMTYEGFESSPATVLNDISNKKVLLLVYRDDCIHCKNLKPAWQKAEQQEPDKMVAINVTESNSANQALTSKLNITSYPAMLVMDNGNVAKVYDGGRSTADLLQEVKSM